VGGHAQLATAITAAGEGGVIKLTFAQQLGQMFSVGLPKVDATLPGTVSGQWQIFWLLPAGMAAGIAVLLFLAFGDESADGGAGGDR
jgi:hypothetical protein